MQMASAAVDFNASVMDSSMYLSSSDESLPGLFDMSPNANNMNGVNDLNLTDMNMHDLTMNVNMNDLNMNDLHNDLNMHGLNYDLNMTDMNIPDLNMTDMNIFGLNMTDTNMTDMNIMNDTNMTGMNMAGLNIPGPNMNGMDTNDQIMTELHGLITHDLKDLGMDPQDLTVNGRALINSLYSVTPNTIKSQGSRNPTVMLEDDGSFSPIGHSRETVPGNPHGAFAEIECIQGMSQDFWDPTLVSNPAPCELLQETLPRPLSKKSLSTSNNRSTSDSLEDIDNLHTIAQALKLPHSTASQLLPTLAEIKNLKYPTRWNASLDFDEPEVPRFPLTPSSVPDRYSIIAGPPQKISLGPSLQEKVYAYMGYIIAVTAKRFLIQEYHAGRIPYQAIQEAAAQWAEKKSSRLSMFNYSRDTQRELIEQLQPGLKFGSDPRSIASSLASWNRIAQDLKSRERNQGLFVSDRVIRKHFDDCSKILRMLRVPARAWEAFLDVSHWGQRRMIGRLAPGSRMWMEEV